MMLRYAYPGGPATEPRAALQLARRPTPLFTVVARRIADAVNFVPCRDGMPLSSGAVSVPTGDGFGDSQSETGTEIAAETGLDAGQAGTA